MLIRARNSPGFQKFVVKKFINFIFIVFVFCSCSQKKIDRFSEQRKMMGTFVNIQVLAPSNKRKQVREAMNAAFKTIEELEKKTSRFLPESDPDKIEKLKPNEILKVSSWSTKCFQIADEVTKQTRGLYYITSGPLVDLWGFGRSKTKNARIPRTALQSL